MCIESRISTIEPETLVRPSNPYHIILCEEKYFMKPRREKVSRVGVSPFILSFRFHPVVDDFLSITNGTWG